MPQKTVQQLDAYLKATAVVYNHSNTKLISRKTKVKPRRKQAFLSVLHYRQTSSDDYYANRRPLKRWIRRESRGTHQSQSNTEDVKQKLHLFVRTSLSKKPKTLYFELHPETSVTSLKETIQKRIGVEARYQRLYIGRNFQLCDLLTLEENGVGKDEIISLHLSEDGPNDDSVSKDKANIDDEYLKDLSSKSELSWKELAEHLGYEEAEIADIQSSNKGSNEAGRHVLLTWWEKTTDRDEKAQQLRRALEAIGLTDLTQNVPVTNDSRDEAARPEPDRRHDAGVDEENKESKVTSTKEKTQKSFSYVQVFIRCNLTQKLRTLCFQLDPEISVWCLKHILNEVISVHPQQQRLFIRRNSRNFELCNLLTLHDYGIQRDENISLRLCTDGLLGGGPKTEISESILSDVARRLGHDWKDLAIHLGFKSADISTFEADNPGNVNNQKFQMLVAWRKRQPTIGGQMDVLCAALARIDRNDIVSFLQGRHKKSGQPVGSQHDDDAGTSTRPSTNKIPQTSGVTSREEVGTQPADDAGTSTRPSTSRIPQTSGVTSREEVGTQPDDDAGTSTRPSKSQIPQTSGITSREEVGTQPDDDAGTSTRPSTSQIPQTSGVTSREEVGTQPADDAGTSTRPSTSHGVGVSEDAPICYPQRSGASIGSIGTISGSQISIIVGSSGVNVTYLSQLEVPGSGQQPSTAPQRIGLNPQNAGTDPTVLTNIQHLVTEYIKDQTIPAHPLDPCRTMGIDQFSELELTQNVEGNETAQEPIHLPEGTRNLDKAKTKPLDSMKDMLNVIVTKLRVLLSGGAGFGKSTLLLKAANASTDTTSVMAKFKLVFPVKLRQMQQTSCVLEAIIDQILPNIQKAVLKKVIEDNEVDTAFILDGLDEIPSNVLNSPAPEGGYGIKDILYNKVLTHSTVLVSTRPHMIDFAIKGYPRYAQIKTLGFTLDTAKKYITSYFATKGAANKGQSFITHLSSSSLMGTLAQIPILVLFMCIVWDNLSKLPEKLTALYKEFAEALVSRRCNEGEDQVALMKSVVHGLGPVALAGLLDPKGERLVFSSEMFDEKTLNDGIRLGFIQQESFTSGLKKMKVVAFLHKSMQEYFAADYFANLHHENEEKFHERLKQINPDNVDAMEYLLRFACGILSGSPATALILEHVQKQCFERRLSADNYKLQQLLLFESGWTELADKLDRPDIVECFSQEHLLAMHYYLKCLRQPLEELKHLSVHCRSHEELASLRGIDSLLHDNTIVNMYLAITGRLDECLELLGEIQPIDNIRSIQKFGVHFDFIVSEKTDEERQTPVEVYERFRDVIFLRVHVEEKSHVDKHVLESLSCVRKQVEQVALRRRTYDDGIGLAKALAGCDMLQRVYVYDTNLHGHLADVAPLVPPCLKSLTLKSCGLNDDDIPDLMSILPAGHGLLALYIQHNAFSVVGVETLTAHLRNRLPKLHHIYTLHQSHIP